MLRTIDLFAGCGGLSKGFELAGFPIQAAVELWPAAAECYRANFEHPVLQTDLSDVPAAIDALRPFGPELVIGGPPCQDFSSAGKRVEAGRAELTGCYADIVAGLRPRCFVMENVGRARLSEAYRQARSRLKEAGYGLTELVLDASLCGAPQKRKRFFCFGALGEEDGFALDLFQARLADRPMTLRDYCGPAGPGFTYYYRHPRNYSRRAIFSIDEPAPTMRGVNRPIPKGYPGHPLDACPVGPEVHPLTSRDRALIQTFPPDFRWIGSKSDVEQMIGNAVPVELARFVANTVALYLESKAGTAE